MTDVINFDQASTNFFLLLNKKDYIGLNEYIKTLDIPIFAAIITAHGTKIVESILDFKLDFKQNLFIIPILSYAGQYIRSYKTTTDFLNVSLSKVERLNVKLGKYIKEVTQ